MRPLHALFAPALLAAVAGCAPAAASSASPPAAANSVAPTPAITARPSPTPSPGPTVAPRPSGALAWPTAFDVELEQGTYFSSPPFGVPFTIEVGEPGWFSGHLHAEFFDLLRFDGVAHTELPTRMLTFGVAGHIRGPDGDVPVDGLTAESAADLVAGAAYRTTSNRGPIELLGLDGVVIDVHSELDNTPIYGGAAGNFGLSPERDLRLAILERDGELLLVGMLAEADDLDGAWAQAQAILETLRFT